MTEPVERVWRLHRGDELLAEIVVTGGDFPWLIGRATTYPAFDRYAPIFSEVATYIAETSDDAEWLALQQDVMANVTLRHPNGDDVGRYLLYIDGDHASWRWSPGS
jgi:hypothetical protein